MQIIIPMLGFGERFRRAAASQSETQSGSGQ